MRVLVLGSDGFIGRNVALVLSYDHEVYTGTRRKDFTNSKQVHANLLEKAQLVDLFNELLPDAIINCAGIVDTSKDTSLNKTFTENILKAVTASKANPQRIIIIGSAGEYGVVGSKNLPVDEETPLAADSGYGLSKRQETTFALEYAKQHNLPVVIARGFNPIGYGMGEKFLTSRIIGQINEIKYGSRREIEVSRLDACRDYIDIRDVARAIKVLVDNKPKFDVYNIGSGISTSNKELVEMLVKGSKMVKKPRIIETSPQLEPIFAIQADISRMYDEFGWKPIFSINDAVKEITTPLINNAKIKLVIIGAGKAGELIAEDIEEKKDSAFEVIGFVDDDSKKLGKKIKGKEVLGAIADLRSIITEYKVEELLIAIPSGRGEIIRKIIDGTVGLRVGYKILPRLSEVLLQNFKEDYVKYIRKVQPEDLLGGEILKSDQKEITDYTKGQTIMLTGAAGSIGSELSRQIVAYGAEKVILYDRWENGVFELRNQLIENFPDLDIVFVIGDIKDRKRLNSIMAEHKPTTIFHAAAYKHVPLMESNPSESIKNNILGTKTVAEIAIENKVKKFILISTDKAVNPTNVMGATKRAAEKIINILSQSQTDTIFCAVRFGNVINSNGSAIPIFEKQIEKGGPVTVTHKDITRFFMTIPEAVHLVLQAWVMGENNDLFVLDMGEPIKIYELARLLITLHGYVPDEDIKIKIVGLRPGEKLYEEVLVKEEEISSTAVKKVFRTKNHQNFDSLVFLHNLSFVLESVDQNSIEASLLPGHLQKMVSTYHPSRH